MTHQNKIALVVGFALVILAGVLISDHLSQARMDPPPRLPPRETPIAASITDRAEIIDLTGPFRLDPGPAHPVHGADPVFDHRPEPEPPARRFEAAPGDEAAPTRRPVPEAAAARNESAAANAPQPPARGEAPATHVVRAGESLSSICMRHYRDPGLAEALARANGLDDPDHVVAGTRLRVPARAALEAGSEGGGGAAPARVTAPAAGPQTATYTVRPGETLRRIAKRLLDSPAEWPRLYELNRDVIEDPDHLVAGTVIRVPPRG